MRCLCWLLRAPVKERGIARERHLQAPTRAPLFSQQSPGLGVEAKGGVPPHHPLSMLAVCGFQVRHNYGHPSAQTGRQWLSGVCALLDHRLCTEAMADPLPNLPAYTCFLHPPTHRAPGPWLRLQCFDSAESWVQVSGTLRCGEGWQVAGAYCHLAVGPGASLCQCRALCLALAS